MEPAEKSPSSSSASGDTGEGTGARSAGQRRGSKTAGASVSSSSASAPTSAASSADAASWHGPPGQARHDAQAVTAGNMTGLWNIAAARPGHCGRVCGWRQRLCPSPAIIWAAPLARSPPSRKLESTCPLDQSLKGSIIDLQSHALTASCEEIGAAPHDLALARSGRAGTPRLKHRRCKHGKQVLEVGAPCR
jgi:hypothetical protein